ncbi:FkbM family methyltransferase [Aureibaculum sp. 2210JD6-5]|uniref:FkbM family methyltransferase n=1 Tax=Aureibaculum sp. 2210JD6-5 TaxID=3103957 RepID=UPI002AAED564|nr:FkbM family methyltransferase [Aureibaculum sp. 2210JD6-5]MDY7393691.1 FkbM family methyltransferase [Aureibaculum sp. 2210JD6-5]
MIKKIKTRVEKLMKHGRFRLSSNNNPLFIGYYKYFYRPKKGSISEFIHEYSLSKGDSFFVIQIGANDGINNDPIHKFIKRDSWKGVLLEPQSYVHKQYLSQVYKKNKGIHTLNAAISSENGSQKLYKIGFCDMRWATGLASFQRESLEKAFSSGQVEGNCRKYNVEIPTADEQIVTEDIMTISPETLIEKYKISKIDLLQIDTEGYDYEVIKIFNIEKFKPKVVIFENKHLSEKDLKECCEHFIKNSYAVKNFGRDTIAMQYPLESFEKFFVN